jgi:hypothetical protein
MFIIIVEELSFLTEGQEQKRSDKKDLGHSFNCSVYDSQI